MGNQQPKKKEDMFRYTMFQIAMDLLCLAVLVGFFAYLGAQWNTIPDEVMTFYTAEGEISGILYKQNLLILPMIAGIVFVVLTMVGFFYRFADKEPDWLRRQLLKERMKNLIVTVKAILILMFCYVTYCYFHGSTVSFWAVIVFLLLLFVTLIYHTRKVRRIALIERDSL